MVIEFRSELMGARELDRALAQLPKATSKSVLRTALKRAAKPVLSEAEARVPVKSGGLRDSLAISTKLSPRQRRFQMSRGFPQVFVGASWPEGAHAHLVEFGTQAHTIKVRRKKIMSDGTTFYGTEFVKPATSPRPFLRPAWDATKKEVLKIFGREVWTILQKTAQRFAKQAAAGKLGKGASRFFSRVA